MIIVEMGVFHTQRLEYLFLGIVIQRFTAYPFNDNTHKKIP